MPAEGDITDPTLAAALRAADPISPETIDETVRVWRRAPIQVLARLALIASPTGPELADAPTDARSSDAGRPVGDEKLSAAMKEQRLHLLGDLVSGGTSVPDTVLSAVVHGELLTMRPFADNNGIVARAASRLTTIAGPRGSACRRCTDQAPRRIPRRRGSVSPGDPEGVRRWILPHLPVPAAPSRRGASPKPCSGVFRGGCRRPCCVEKQRCSHQRGRAHGRRGDARHAGARAAEERLGVAENASASRAPPRSLQGFVGVDRDGMADDGEHRSSVPESE